MKEGKRCPKCGSKEIIRVPDDAHRYLANSICITGLVTVKRIPITRYVCYECGKHPFFHIKRAFQNRRRSHPLHSGAYRKRAF